MMPRSGGCPGCRSLSPRTASRGPSIAGSISKPRPSYSPRAPVGLSASTPSIASRMPASRSRRSDSAVIARPRPRRRHGRRTLIRSSQPRATPMRSFSSGQIQFWTTPAISSPSQATTHRSVRNSFRSSIASNEASVQSRGSQWSRNASYSARAMSRTWCGWTGRRTTPSGSGASGMSSRLRRSIRKIQRIGTRPSASRMAR